MPAHGRRSPARFIAPLALLVCAVAVVAVIGGSSTGGDDTPDTASGTDDTSGSSVGTTTSATTAPRTPANYTIQTGDTLGAIAEKTGTTVDDLLTLNPELDPQALVAGQRIKLRE